MASLFILNGEGLRKEISVFENDAFQTHPQILNTETYCLTCGYVPKKTEHLEVFHVGSTEGLKTWLKQRSHIAFENDNVLLCAECKGEGNF